MTHFFNKIIMMVFLVCISTHVSLASDAHVFSAKEKEWLKDNSHIRLLVSTSLPPISMWQDSSNGISETNKTSQPGPDISPMDSDISFSEVKEGEHEGFKGVAADYLLEIGKITGITFVTSLVFDKNFDAIPDAFQSGKADLMPAMKKGQTNGSKFFFTDTYISLPVVVIMRSDAPFLEDITELNSMKVAGGKSIQQKLDSLELRVKLHHLSAAEALKGVASGSYDAFLSGLADLYPELARTPVTNIKIAGELPFSSEFCMAVAPQNRGFVPIFNKALGVISQEKKDEIWKKWFSITYEKEYFSSGWLWGFGLSSIFALITGAAGFSYYRGHFSKSKSGTEALDSQLLCVHTNENTTITEVTKAFCEATGFEPDYLVDKPFSIINKPVVACQSTLEMIFESARKDRSWQGEIGLTKKDGSELCADVVISPQRRKDDRVGGFTAVYQDATKRKHEEILAIRDELTGLYNKRHFNTMPPVLLKQASERKLFFGMFLLEVDSFKKYNDNYGDSAGNKVLASIGDALREILQRDDDLCFRLGGEEFSVVTLFGDAEGATNIAEKILNSISDLKIEHKETSAGVISISIGVRVITGGYRGDMETIYQQADKALYEAKESGGNRFVGFDGRTELQG